MFNEVRKEIDWEGKKLIIETGKIARQANGSVIVKYGNTTVLCAVTIAPKAALNVDFFPLTVNYTERSYAIGKIPGGFIKRETKPSDYSILVSRLIDRTIRPLFPAGFHNEVNIVCTVLSYDPEHSSDIAAFVAASAALAISDAPVEEIVVGARVGLVDGEFVLNPSAEVIRRSSTLDLVIGGTESSILMIESEVKELSEEKVLDAINFVHKKCENLANLIKDLRNEAGKKKMEVAIQDLSEVKKEVESFCKDRLVAAFGDAQKQTRAAEIEKIKEDVKNKFVTEELSATVVTSLFKDIEKDIVRGNILNGLPRIDGRKFDEIRNISIETGILPQVHGSALFTRGETQALVITTLGSSSKDEQIVESLDPGITKENFLLHYNFPPYSVGEVGQLRAPGRREIGHGKLAWRALNPLFSNIPDFSYVTRIVSEITESNGSSSMATVCGASMSMMDAGVPLRESVSGIAMGLIKEGDKYTILSDIMGDEDHLGDMDFKVAGTKNGITSLQMDIKISGINTEIMSQALSQAKAGRAHILAKMDAVISEPRKSLNSNVPRIETMMIPVKKIKDVIGSKGKVIKEICETSGASVDIDDTGTVKISSSSNDSIQKAVSIIKSIIFEPNVGDIYEGKVVKVIDAGAFVNIAGNVDGFVHISELAEYRVDFVEDVVNEGDAVKVKVIGFDKKNRPKLSYRYVNQSTGDDISASFADKPAGSDSFGDKEQPKRKFFS